MRTRNSEIKEYTVNPEVGTKVVANDSYERKIGVVTGVSSDEWGHKIAIRFEDGEETTAPRISHARLNGEGYMDGTYGIGIYTMDSILAALHFNYTREYGVEVANNVCANYFA